MGKIWKKISILCFLALFAAMAVMLTVSATVKTKNFSGENVPELDESGMFVLGERTSVQRGYRLPEEIGGDVGVLFTGETYGTSVLYTNVVNLNDLTGDVVRFEAPLTERFGTAGFEVTMVDLYNPENRLSVTWSEAENIPWATRVTVGYQGVSLGRNNQLGKITIDSSGAIITSNNFSGRFSEAAGYAHEAFSFRFDADTSEVFIDPIYPGSEYLLLNAEESLGFEGFTTGEVLLEFRFLKLKNVGGVVFTQIGGRNMPGGVTAQPSNCIRVETEPEYYEDALPAGVVGKDYPIPKVVPGDGIRADFDVSMSLMKNGRDVSALLNENKTLFLPNEAGEYILTYTAKDINGFPAERVFHIRIGTDYEEISLLLQDEEEDWLFGAYRGLPVVSASGGCGKILLDYTYYYNGNEISADANGEIRLTEPGEIKVVAKATDYLGITEEKEWDFAVKEYARISLEEAMPLGVQAGTELNIPVFTAFDEQGNTLETRVLVNGEQVTGNTVSVSEEESFEVCLQGLSGGKVVAEKIFSVETFAVGEEDPAGYILAEGFSKTNDRLGVKLESATGNGKIVLPNPISVEEIYFDIVGVAGSSNYEYLDLRLTDSLDDQVSVTLRICPAAGGTVVRARGADGDFTVSYGTDAVLDDGNYVFCMFDGKTGILYDSSAAKEYLRVAYTDNGHLFTGFASGEVFAEIVLGNGSEGCAFCLRQLSNQRFAYSRNWSDRSGPVIYLKGSISAEKYSLGTKIELPAAQATDVLQRSSTVTLTVTAPSGKNILDKASVDGVHSFTMEEYGSYRVAYLATDAAGQETLKSYTLECVDTEVPKLTVNGTFEPEYDLGAEVILPDFSATDNLTDVEAYILICTPGRTWNSYSAGDKYRFSETGTYRIVYYARDAAYNLTRKEFEINVARAEQ